MKSILKQHFIYIPSQPLLFRRCFLLYSPAIDAYSQTQLINHSPFSLISQLPVDTIEVLKMQDHGMIPVNPVDETIIPKATKRKPAARKLPKNLLPENMHGSHELNRLSKRNSKSDSSQMFQQQEKSTSDSLPDSSTSNEYRSLRRKYLLLEEERFNLGRETKDIQDAVKSLEDEKLALLDELVVLEGLVDPSEIDPTLRSL